jgi:glycosyltransferase involved in cell wall biosynthesis
MDGNWWMSKKMNSDGISVIICCYNSALRLKQTIRHLAEQKMRVGINWEIIIVNNASSDNTTETANAEWQNCSIPGVSFRVIDEAKPGLSNAREKGIQNSNFDYVIFCDDDNWLDAGYVDIAYHTISANPMIATLGGQSTAVADIPLPGWFAVAASNYAVGQQAAQTGDISSRKFLWGSGIVIRKTLYKSAFANFPSLLTGRYGDELTSGEDSEMCMRFLLMGYQLFYSAELKFEHFISKERLTPQYNERLMAGFIKAHEILIQYSRIIDISQLKFKDKLTLYVKSILRLLALSTTPLRRWNAFQEKLNIFIITGYLSKSLPKDIVLIKSLIPAK